MRLYAISQRSIAFILLVGVLLQSCTNLQIGSWPEEKINNPHDYPKPTSLHQPITHDLQSKHLTTHLEEGSHTIQSSHTTSTSNQQAIPLSEITAQPLLHKKWTVDQKWYLELEGLMARLTPIWNDQAGTTLPIYLDPSISTQTISKLTAKEQKSYFHLHCDRDPLTHFNTPKAVYIGKMGLLGGVEEYQCPYRAKVSEGSTFTYHWGSKPTDRVDFEPHNGHWRGNVRHTSHFRGDADWECHWGWVKSNYSDLSAEELEAAEKTVIYDCPWYKFGYIEDIKYILAYLTPTQRKAFREKREKQRQQEAQAIADQEIDRQAKEKLQQQKKTTYQAERATLLAQKTVLEKQCTQLGTQNTQTATLFEKVAQYHKKNLATAQKLKTAQQDNLHTAKRLFQDTTDLTKALQQTQQLVESLQQTLSQDQQKKEALQQRIAQRKDQLEQAQKGLADLQAGRTGGNDFFQLFFLDAKINALEQEKQKKNQIQATIEALESAISKEQADLAQEEKQLIQLETELAQKIAQEAVRKVELTQLDAQLTQQKSKLVQELAHTQVELSELNKTHNSTTHLAEQVTQSWRHNEALAKDLVSKKKQNNDTIKRIIPATRLDAPAILEEQLEKAQQHLKEATQQKQQAQAQQVAITKGTQARSQKIKQLQAQIEAINKQYQPTGQTKPLAEVEIQHHDLEQQLKQLIQQVNQEKIQLQHDQQVAQQAKATLGQKIAQEKAKQGQLEVIEKELKERLEEGKVLNEQVKEAFDEELARNIAADKETTALIEQLRKQVQLLRDQQAPKHRIDQLEKLACIEETAIREQQATMRQAAHMDLQEKMLQLQNAQTMREQAARRKVELVDTLLAVKQEVHQAEQRAWEEQNKRILEEHIRQMEELTRQAIEDQKREIRRDQEDVENARRKKEWENRAWYEKVWDWAKENPITATIVGIVAVGALVYMGAYVVVPLVKSSIASTGASGFFSWLFSTKTGLGVLCTFGGGWLQGNLERINNWGNGRGWKTDDELKVPPTQKDPEDQRQAQEREEKINKELEHLKTNLDQLQQLGKNLQAEVLKKEEEALVKSEQLAKEWLKKQEPLAATQKAPLQSTPQATSSSLNERIQQEINMLKEQINEQPAPSQEATPVTDYAKQAQELLKQWDENRDDPALIMQTSVLLEQMDQRVQTVEAAKQEVEVLSQQHVFSSEFKANLASQASDLQSQLDTLKQAKDQLQQKINGDPAQQQAMLFDEGFEEFTNKLHDLLFNSEYTQKAPQNVENQVKEVTEDQQESLASYEELAQQFQHLTNTTEFTQEIQQTVDDLLQQATTNTKTDLQPQAQAVKEGLESLVKHIQAKQARLNYVNFEDDSDFLQEKLALEAKQLADQSNKAQTAIDKLCRTFNLGKPDLKPTPPITAETIKNTINFILDTAPSGELVKILLGTAHKPETIDDYLKLTTSVAIDFLPIGKIVKLAKGPAGKAFMHQLEKQVLKGAEKRALQQAAKAGVKGVGMTAKESLSLGSSAKSVKKWLQSAGDLEREVLIQNIEAAGFKLVSPPTAPLQVYERTGKKGMRIRLDPPQKGTSYNHMHLEYNGNSYSISLNSVNRTSPEAHIPIK